MAALKLGGGIKLPASWPILDGIHLEGGYVRGLRNPFEENGGTFAAGIATKPLRLGFTYAGATIRLKYQWFWMEETLEGPFFEVVFH